MRQYAKVTMWRMAIIESVNRGSTWETGVCANAYQGRYAPLLGVAAVIDGRIILGAAIEGLRSLAVEGA
jgi:hypothetical protein